MRPKWAVLYSLLVVALALPGCRESEQGRVLLFEKGSYLGKPDTAISEEARRALRQRSELQRGTTALLGPAGGRPALSAPAEELRARAAGQREPVAGSSQGGGIGLSQATRDALRARVDKQRY